jgi:hypothetical protein
MQKMMIQPIFSHLSQPFHAGDESVLRDEERAALLQVL